jgi:class 3 adenylate cyclase/tetratricopeptide (TPR) repeat protein
MGDESDRRVIEAAIAAQEQLRGTLGDAIVDATIAALRARVREHTADSPVEHERRLVTVLFMDVVDSTRTFVGRDPEEMMTIMDGALQTLAEPVRVCGGRVTKFTGDGFLAVFGLHRTRENDAEMAVRAGLRILESARTIASDVASTHNLDGFQVRVGINTGLVVTGGVTEAEDTVMGSAVNLASRIESAAPPGGMLVSQSTYRQVRGRFVMESVGTIDAKGFPEPIPAHLVTAKAADGLTRSLRGVEGALVETVGRRTELNTLLTAIDQVVSSRTGRTITIVGDAGIGKSRLLAEFEASLPEDPTVVTFRAHASLENIDVPHALLRDLVERRFEIRGDDSPAVVRTKLAEGFGTEHAVDPTWSDRIDVVGRFLGYLPAEDTSGRALGPHQLRDRAVGHLVAFFARAAAAGALLLLLDDLQWADDSSISVLREIIEELAPQPLLTIALTRPESREGDDDWANLPNHMLVPLEPMSTEESEALLDSILEKIDDCPPELRTRLVEHAGGNPYYLEELVMMCIDDGVIVPDDQAWSVHMDRLATLRVPTTLTGVIRARLDGLSPEEHTTLQQASVVGRVFWDQAIARLAASTGAVAVDAPLRLLERRGMITQRATSLFSNVSEFAFTNTLLRDATYDEVLLDTRRRYHSIVADWLVTASGDREQEFVGVIAGHLEKAGRHSEALEYLTRAGDAAWSSYAITAAADFYDRALALAPTDDLERRYELLLARERTSALQGDPDGQRRTLDELETVTEDLGDRAKQAFVAHERTFFFFYTGDYEDALISARRAADYAAATDDAALQSRVETTQAWALVYLQDWSAARSHGERALELALEAGLDGSEATAQNALGMIALTLGNLTEARTRLGRALEIARADGDQDGASIYLNNLAVVLMTLGDYAVARTHFSEILDRTIASGDHRSESSALLNLAWVDTAEETWVVARRHAEQGLEMKRRQRHVEAQAEALVWLGHALVGLGDLDGAESAYTESVNIRRELAQPILALGARAGMCRVALARGEIDDALAHTETILEHLDGGESLEGTWEPLRIHLTVVEALQAADDDRARRVLMRANKLLRERASKIDDDNDRRSYLEAIPWHRRLAQLAASLPA